MTTRIRSSILIIIHKDFTSTYMDGTTICQRGDSAKKERKKKKNVVLTCFFLLCGLENRRIKGLMARHLTLQSRYSFFCVAERMQKDALWTAAH